MVTLFDFIGPRFEPQTSRSRDLKRYRLTTQYFNGTVMSDVSHPNFLNFFFQDACQTIRTVSQNNVLIQILKQCFKSEKGCPSLLKISEVRFIDIF